MQARSKNVPIVACTFSTQRKSQDLERGHPPSNLGDRNRGLLVQSQLTKKGEFFDPKRQRSPSKSGRLERQADWYSGPQPYGSQRVPISPACLGAAGRLGESKVTKTPQGRQHKPDQLISIQETAFPAGNGKRIGRRCGLRRPFLSVPTSQGGKFRREKPHPVPKSVGPPPSPPPLAVKRARGPDPKPPPPAAWHARRERGGPAPSRGTPGARPTPDERRGAAGGGSRDKKQGRHEAGGGFAPPEKGGGASRARARTECPDAALRQSGPERGAGDAEERRLRGPSISIRVSRPQSPRRVPPNPHLKERGCKGKTSRPARGASGAKQNGDIGLPLPPLSAASRQWCGEDPTCDRCPGPTEKQKPNWELTSSRAGAPPPPRALTYRLRPCPRTRAQAGKQQNSNTTEHRRLED